jgi:CMP-N,N'-diacetyllegionaminic acid synthase
MYKESSILAIIPARGGSKGLPNKNILEIHGQPLISWTLGSTDESELIDRVFVSTDSEEIARVSAEYGADIPFLRPNIISRDESPSYELIIHALDEFASRGETFEYVALLEPTSPLRKKGDVDKAIRKCIDNTAADALVSFGSVHTEHPSIVKRLDKQGFVVPYIDDAPTIFQRQQADGAYFPYGVIYISKVSKFYETKSFYTSRTVGYGIERWQNYEIDDEYDFACVESIMKLKFPQLEQNSYG